MKNKKVPTFKLENSVYSDSRKLLIFFNRKKTKCTS